MKKRKIQLLLLILMIANLHSANLLSQDIKYKKIKKAKGTLNWKLEDTKGNIIKEGKIVDGEWRQSGGMLIDYLILDKDENNTIKTAFILLGTKRCPMMNLAVQIYHDGEFYPGKKYKQRYTVKPKDWDDSGTKYGMGNKNIMLFDFGAVSCRYRSMAGCFINHIKIPNEESYLQANIEDKYIFYILGGTDYQWTK